MVERDLVAKAEEQARLAREARDAYPEEYYEAAKVVGCKVSELQAVHQVEGRLVIQQAGSPALVLVPADRPDAAGRSGLMLWAPLPVAFSESVRVLAALLIDTMVVPAGMPVPETTWPTTSPVVAPSRSTAHAGGSPA